ncbi:hypothetical protein P5673_028606, partial [Acropora cervicornis]
MNDISRCSKKLSLILFGDDTNLFHSHKNVDISCNKLSLNVKKTHFMVKCTKFLGLYIDDELFWRKHIDQISTKISKMRGIMAKPRHILSIQTLKTIYNTMAYPYLTYCS